MVKKGSCRPSVFSHRNSTRASLPPPANDMHTPFPASACRSGVASRQDAALYRVVAYLALFRLKELGFEQLRWGTTLTALELEGRGWHTAYRNAEGLHCLRHLTPHNAAFPHAILLAAVCVCHEAAGMHASLFCPDPSLSAAFAHAHLLQGGGVRAGAAADAGAVQLPV